MIERSSIQDVDDATWRGILRYLASDPTFANYSAKLPSVVDRVISAGGMLGDDTWIIPRKNALVVQTGWKFAARRAYEQGAKHLCAALVYDGETIHVRGDRVIEHIANPFGDPTRKVIGAWARVTGTDSTEWDGIVTKSELDKIATGNVWKDWFGPMAKKTALLRALKFSRYSFDVPDDHDADDAPPVRADPVARLAARTQPVTPDEITPPANIPATDEF